MAATHAEFYESWLGPASAVEEGVVCSPCESRDFDPGLKCCTYFPFLPNFTLGALLTSGDRAVVLRVKAALAQGRATPLGLFAPEGYRSRARQSFGRDARLLCPFLDTSSGGCAIWSHRPGVCSSFFCKSSRGEAGLAAWRETEARVNLFEWTLAHEVLWRIGFTQDEIERMNPEACEDGSGDGSGKRPAPGVWPSPPSVWLEWRGREQELFASAFQIAREVSPSEVASLLETCLDEDQDGMLGCTR